MYVCTYVRKYAQVQLNEIVECMYEREYQREQLICREGGVGTQLYVLAGKCTVYTYVRM